MLALQKDNEMRFMKSLFDTFRYNCKISAECPWLKGNDSNSDDDLDGVYMEMPPEDQYMNQIHVSLWPANLHCFYVDVHDCRCL